MHGGDILKFAGDAIIVCWSPTRELGIEVCEGGRTVLSSGLRRTHFWIFLVGVAGLLGGLVIG